MQLNLYQLIRVINPSCLRGTIWVSLCTKYSVFACLIVLDSMALWGACMVMWTKKMSRYLKTIVVKWLKLVEKCCLNQICFHDGLYCYVKQPNLEYHDEIFTTYIHGNVQKQMVRFGLGINFMTLAILNFILFHIPLIHCTLEVIIKYVVKIINQI